MNKAQEWFKKVKQNQYILPVTLGDLEIMNRKTLEDVGEMINNFPYHANNNTSTKWISQKAILAQLNSLKL